MTFEEWRATRRLVESIDDEIGTTCGEGPGYVYAGGCFIELNITPWVGHAVQYILTIENWSTLSASLESLELSLWERWAKDEIEVHAHLAGNTSA